MPATVELRQSSISTTGYLDGLGRRSIRFDREFGATLECLHVRPELRAYEDALLAQACAISELGDLEVVRIRSLEREQGRLVVISELPHGDRLSDVFDLRPTGASSSIEATFGFLLQILPTLAGLHRGSVVHGAIAPGRVIVETGGRVVLADAVFGTALPRLNLSRQRLWHELQIAFGTEHDSAGSGADVAQAALCSVAIALGRQLDTDDPRQALPSMIEHLEELALARAGERLSRDVRALFRALLPVYGAASEATAEQAADRVREIAARDLDENACMAAFADFVRYDAAPTVIASFDEGSASTAPTIASTEFVETDFVEEDSPAPAEPIPAHAAVDTAPTSVRTMFGFLTDRQTGEQEGRDVSVFRRGRALLSAAPVSWKIAAAAALVVGGGFFAGRSFMQADSGTVNASTSPAPASVSEAPAAPVTSPNASMGILSVSTQPEGARVLVDGVLAGHTPLRLDSVAPGRHTVTTIAGNVSTKRTVHVEAGKIAVVDFPAAPIPAETGWVTVHSPVSLEVSAGGRKLGTSDQRRILLAAGRHTITLSNRAVAYSSAHTVQVGPGDEAVLNVAPTGRVNLNAQPWAEVWIDGARAGETPVANLEVPLGSREFVFKHPQYGERKLTATVSTKPTALSVDFTKPSQRP